MTAREDLADLIYRAVNPEQWNPTIDGTGNVACHIAADAAIAAGWTPPVTVGDAPAQPLTMPGSTPVPGVRVFFPAQPGTGPGYEPVVISDRDLDPDIHPWPFTY